MTNKEKIASTVQRIVGQVLEETYDEKIFDEIYNLSLYLRHPEDTSFKDNNLQLFEEFSYREMKKTHSSLKKQLLKKINHKRISFLRTMRCIQALRACVVDSANIDLAYILNFDMTYLILQFYYLQLKI